MMTPSNQLPYLLKLLEDESPPVREAVMQQFTSLGPALSDEIKKLHIALTVGQRTLLQPLLDVHAREWLKGVWSSWSRLRGDKEKLESALGMIAEYLGGRLHLTDLTELLDNLTQDFHAAGVPLHAADLAHFLFHHIGLGAVAQEDYYNPQNSDLVYTVEHKRGIPISLACVYILVGHRLGLSIEGCNFPGHFMAIATIKRRRVLVDCFNSGRFIEQVDFGRINASITVEDILRLECHAPAIIARVLRNLAHAYQQTASHENAHFIHELLSTLEPAGV